MSRWPAAPLWPMTTDLAEIEAVPLADRGLPRSTYDLLIRAATLWPHRPAAVLLPSADQWLGGVTWTFADLRDEVHRVANAFSALGVRRDDPIGLLSRNGGSMLTAILAAQAVAIAQPINPDLSSPAIAEMLRLSGARFLVAAGPELDPEIWTLAVELGEQLNLEIVLALRPDACGPSRPSLATASGSADSWVRTDYVEALALEQSPHVLLRDDPPEPEHISGYFHASGTAGAPKLAAHTHGAEVAMAWSIAAGFGLRGDATILAGLPLFQVNAFLVTVLAPLFRGQRVLWTGPAGYYDPNLRGVIWRVIDRYAVGMVFGVPTVYAELAEIPIDADISSLAYVVVSEAPLAAVIRERFESRTGVPLCETYSLAEATCAISWTRPGVPRIGSIARRLPYQQIAAVQVDAVTGEQRALPPGEGGPLMVSGPTVIPGYLRRAEDGAVGLESAGKIAGGWLDTGSTGRVDDDGFVYLSARTDDLIICRGHHIEPAAIEEALLEHPDVIAASAVGCPDPESGEVPVAYVTVRPPSVAGEADLRSWAAGCVADPLAAPANVYILDALPSSLSGEPSKAALREDALRRVILAELTALRLRDLAKAVRVTTVDDCPAAVLMRPCSSDEADTIRAFLSRYSFSWVFEGAE